MSRSTKPAKPYIVVFCEGESEQAYTDFLRKEFKDVASIHRPKATGLFDVADSKYKKDTKYRDYAEVTDEVWFFFDVETKDISIGRRKGTLYYLNRMFSPIFGISFRTRGGYNFVMPTALFESLLTESWEPEKIKNWKEKTQKNAHLPSVKSISSENCVDPNQLSMFEV